MAQPDPQVPEDAGLPLQSRRLHPEGLVAVGLWGEQVVPRLVEKALGSRQHDRLRQQTCAGLTGDVVEIGFGSGRNVPHYPAAVQRVTAVEPSGVAWQMSARRRADSLVPVDRAGLDGQVLPFADASFDSALSTWTLCTVPDPVAALRELARVLRPGGSLLFVEHGAAPDAGVLRWQHRLDPLQRRVAAGCHLSRPIDALLSEAGLHVEELDRHYASGQPRAFGSLYRGRATASRP